MTQHSGKTRQQLKVPFQKGKMPAQEDFEDLIESMLNMIDEGFDKTPADGFKIGQVTDGKLLSFYKNINSGDPIWSIGIDKANNCLNFHDARNQVLLSLSCIEEDDGVQRAKVGIRQSKPRHELDVAGCIASHARIGRAGEFAVPADGNWYDMTDYMTGCQAWEVVAGVGAKDAEGRYALMHAFATNAFNSNGQITYHQSHFGNKCSRIELRWLAGESDKPFEFKLQMRVGCTYGDDVWIKFHMTKLWLDTLMLESEIKPALKPTPEYDDKGKLKKIS